MNQYKLLKLASNKSSAINQADLFQWHEPILQLVLAGLQPDSQVTSPQLRLDGVP